MHLQVAEFVDEDVIDTVNRHLHEVQVEQNVARLGATSPALDHFTDDQRRSSRQVERAGRLQTFFQPMGKNPPGMRAIPVFQKAAYSLSVLPGSRPHMQEATY